MFSLPRGLPSACNLRFKRLYSLSSFATSFGTSRLLLKPIPSFPEPDTFYMRASGGSSESTMPLMAFSVIDPLYLRMSSLAFVTPEVNLAARGTDVNKYYDGVSDAGNLESCT